MNDELHDLDEILRTHGGAPDHLRSFEARLDAGLDEADREMGRAAGGTAWRRFREILGRRRLRLAAAFGAAALAAAAFVLFGLPGSGPVGPPPATAHQLAERMRTALSQATTIQGRVTVTTRSTWPAELQDSPTTTWIRFVGTAAGDWRIESTDIADKRTGGPSNHITTLIFNAAENAWITVAEGPVNRYDPTAGRERTWRRTRGYWSGVGPAPSVDMLARVQPWLPTALAALTEDAPALSVDAVTYDGRPAWRTSIARTEGDPAAGNGSRDTYEIVVDAATGMIVHGSHTSAGASGGLSGEESSTFDVSGLQVDAPLPAGSFSTQRPELALPSTAFVGESRAYDGTCTLGEVARRVGYRPPVPTWTPPGYRRVTVATCPLLAVPQAGAVSQWLGSSGIVSPLTGPLPPDNEVGLTYRRGFETFWIEIVPLSGPRAVPRAALEESGMTSGYAVASETTPLLGGAFEGRRVATGYGQSGAGLLVYGPKVAVFIGGSLTRQEALRVADSLHWYGRAEGGQ